MSSAAFWTSGGMVWAVKSVAAPASSAKMAKLMHLITELPLAECRPSAAPADLRGFRPRRSKCRPDIEEQRIVVPRIAAVAVVIGRRAVELVIRRVLQHQSHILDRQVVEFEDVPITVRFKRVPAGVRPVESAV